MTTADRRESRRSFFGRAGGRFRRDLLRLPMVVRALLGIIIGAASVVLLAEAVRGGEAGEETSRSTTTAESTTGSTALPGTTFTSDPPPERVQVPFVVGKPYDEAARELEDVGLTATRVDEPSGAPLGTVVRQTPKAGKWVDEDASVSLYVSKGVEKVRLASVIDQDVGKAAGTLEGAGFKVEVTEEPSAAAPKGRVLAQSPVGNTDQPKGSTVVLTVSSGKPSKPVPDVSGKDQAQAAAELGRQGFNVATRREASNTVEEGKVIRTDPSAGVTAEEGATVTLVVSSGVEQATVPNLMGKTQEQAVAEIEAAGLKASVQKVASDLAGDGKVFSQTPAAGTKVEKGSTVVIRVGEFGLGSTTTTSSSSTTTSTTR